MRRPFDHRQRFLGAGRVAGRAVTPSLPLAVTPQGGAMQITIVVNTGENVGNRTELEAKEGTPILLGRGEECEYLLWDEVASRRHALLEVRGSELWLIDLGSANGTWIATAAPLPKSLEKGAEGEALRGTTEQRVDRQRLTGGEKIRIGTTILRVETDAFRKRSTAILRPEKSAPPLEVLRRVPWNQVDLGAEVSTDAKRARRLNDLIDQVRAILGADGGAAILARFLDGGCDLLEATGACAVPCALRTDEPLWREQVHAAPPREAPHLSRTLVERVRAEREAVVVADPTRDPQTKQHESIVSHGTRSWLAVPVLAHERLHAIAIFTTAPGAPPFGTDDLALAATLGQVTGLAIASAERLETQERLLAVSETAIRDPLITEDPTFQVRIAELESFARAGGPLLIIGETGTGKELLAKRAHAQGSRPNRPWIVVNCAALPGGLLESELFGHEEGAFTGATARRQGLFELADGGTIFLDEIGELPLDLQPKLLRVLESGEFYRIGGSQPVRVETLILSATHRDLDARVREGTFREDLLYRLGRFRIEVPPLRERPGDLEPITQHLLTRARRDPDRPPPRLAKETGALLRAYPWPGNVRELKNVIERAIVLAGDGVITGRHLALPSDRGAIEEQGTGSSFGGENQPPGEDTTCEAIAPITLRDAEEAAVRAAIRHSEGRRGEAARILGVSEPTLRRKLRAFGLDEAHPSSSD